MSGWQPSRPGVDEDLDRRQREWASGYDCYARLAGDPVRVRDILDPAMQEHARTGVVPRWCGVDLLRGWAHFLIRADRHGGGWGLGQDFTDVLEAVARHPGAGSGERPPLV